MAFEWWKLLKASAYANMSMWTFFTLVALGLALSYTVFVMFGTHQRSNHDTEKVVKDMNKVGMDSTSSQPTVPSSHRWDVFLSFHGKDTRIKFISHLYHALDQAGIKTFRDKPALEKGEDISSALDKAIRNSKMFVVVISENYAASSWCLNELVEIMSCKRTENEVIPVFYYVHPSDVRHHKRSFGVALKKHEKRHSVDRINKWKSALTEIAALSGYHLQGTEEESEADTVQDILKKVLSQASRKVLQLERHLFGIDVAVEEIYRRLSMESNDIRALEICGMGGIGKSTIAKAFYNNYSHEFDISCFVENGKQNSEGALSLLQQLLREFLRGKDFEVRDPESALRVLDDILRCKKALIVFDDLDQSSYFDLLVQIYQQFSVGSRVIFTARDKNLANQLEVAMSARDKNLPNQLEVAMFVDIYMVKHLNQMDSLELFSYHAFKISKPPGRYLPLSKSFASYAEGLPLALRTWGLSLCSKRDVLFWEVNLEKVKKIAVTEIQEALQLSYDQLKDETVQAIFRFIVFFFIGKKINEAIDVFKSGDFFPEVGISILVERCLLTINGANRLQMHGAIQDMGRKLIAKESKDARFRLLHWDHGEASQALPNIGEMDKIEALVIDCTMSTNKYCNAELFEKFLNLKLLKLDNISHIKGIFKASFNELRYISWHGCPWKHLPYRVHMQKLIFLDMSFSMLETLWKIVQLPCLRHLNLEGCKYLKKLPQSIGHLSALYQLNLYACVNLRRLPKSITQLTTLSQLNMSGCEILKLLPELLGDLKGLKRLDASYTAIEKLPDSIADLKKLVFLNLRGCRELRKLPEQFGNMESLEKFYAAESAIEQLPDSFSNLLSLNYLDLSYCSQLKRLPKQLGDMQCLEFLDVSYTAIKEVPDSIGLLPTIKVLNFNQCEKLTCVPNSIRNLKSLRGLYLTREDIIKIELMEAVNDMKLEHLSLSCNIRVCLPIILSFSSLTCLRLRDECGSPSPTKPFSFFELFNLKELCLSNCTSHGSSFPELPPSLECLFVENHASLEQVPDLSNLKQLKEMSIKRCCSLQSLQKLPPRLINLTVTDCTSLQDFPDLSMLRDLERLEVIRNGSNLKVSLEDYHLQLRRDGWSTFGAILQNMDIADWFDYKIRGCTLSFDVPPNLGDNFMGVAFWLVYKCSYEGWSKVEAVITNNTEGMTTAWASKGIHYGTKDYVQSNVHCVTGEDILIKSGDKITVSFDVGFAFPEVVTMCGAHILKVSSQ